MTKAIIFDLGGVIIRDEFILFAEKHFSKLSENEKEEFKAKQFLADCGKLTDQEVGEFWRKYFGPKLWKEINVAQQKAMANPRKNVVKLVSRLKKKYSLGLLSNELNVWSDIAKRQAFIQLFDQVVFSDDVGFKKPSPEIYQIVLEKLGVLPEETIFIDDKEKNVKGAEEVGIKGIEFVNYNKLISDFREII